MKQLFILLIVLVSLTSLVTAQNINTGIQSYLNFTTGDGTDASGNGNDWTVTGTPGTVPDGYVGNGGNYTITSLTASITNAIASHSSFTTSFAIRSTVEDQQSAIYVDADNNGFDLGQVNYNESLFFGNAVEGSYTPSGSLPLNTWTVLTYTHDGTTNITSVYVNGVLTNTTELRIGIADNVEAIMFFDIQDQLRHIDEWGIWNRTLSPSEVSYLVSQLDDGNSYPFAVPPTPPPAPSHGSGPLQVSEQCANAGSEGLMGIGIGLAILVGMFGAIAGYFGYKPYTSTASYLIGAIGIFCAIAIGLSFILGC